MFIHTRLSAPKMSAKSGCQTRTFCNKKRKKQSVPGGFGAFRYRGGGAFLYPGKKYGSENAFTIHEIYAALTQSDSRSDVGSRAWASESAAAKQVEDYKILS